MAKCKGTNSRGKPCKLDVDKGTAYCRFHRSARSGADSRATALSRLEIVQVAIGILLSMSTAIIGWQTYRLNALTSQSNSHLRQIDHRIAETKFGFERIRDIYDRTERYLGSEQDERRGRALVALISSLPDSQVRSSLLSLITVEAESGSIKADAAASYAGDSLANIAASGEYFGMPEVELLQDGSKLRTTSDFGFKDSQGVLWEVPQGTIIEGTIIPKALWPTIGSPFEGKYRDAAIIFDYYMGQRSRPWERVHRVFYEAMIASGVSEVQAKILYAAVYTSGPRWEAP